MESFSIHQKKHTPEVVFNLQTMTLLFRGHSIPEDVAAFYEPLNDFVTKHCNTIRSSKLDLRIEMKLEYFNSATLSYLVRLFKELIGIKGRNHVIIDFYYEDGDDDLRETCQDIADILYVQSNFFRINI